MIVKTYHYRASSKPIIGPLRVHLHCLYLYRTWQCGWFLQKSSTFVNVLAYSQSHTLLNEVAFHNTALLQGSWSCHTAEQHEGSILVLIHLFLSGSGTLWNVERMNESIWASGALQSMHPYGGSLDEVSCDTCLWKLHVEEFIDEDFETDETRNF